MGVGCHSRRAQKLFGTTYSQQSRFEGGIHLCATATILWPLSRAHRGTRDRRAQPRDTRSKIHDKRPEPRDSRLLMTTNPLPIRRCGSIAANRPLSYDIERPPAFCVRDIPLTVPREGGLRGKGRQHSCRSCVCRTRNNGVAAPSTPPELGARGPPPHPSDNPNLRFSSAKRRRPTGSIDPLVSFTS